MTNEDGTGGLRRGKESDPSAQPGILHVILSLNPGGTERLVIDLSKRLRSSAHVFVCCLDEAGAWARELEQGGIPVTALHRRPGFRPALALRIREVARTYGASVLHCHHYSPFVYGALAALATPGLRLVYTEHGRLSDAPPAARRRLANRLFGRIPGEFFAVSENLREHMIASGFPSGRVRVVHNGIALGPRPRQADRAAARDLLGLPETATVYGTIARLDPVKDLGTLLAAFARVPRISENNPLLVIVGDGPERAGLEQTCRTLGVAAWVRFAGYRDDTRRLLPGFDVYVNSSVTEGVSVTLLEAMAAGLPVAATAVGGTAEVVIPEQTGRLVPARAPAALGEAMAALAEDPDRARALGAAGRERVERAFSVERMAERYLETYRALAGCASP